MIFLDAHIHCYKEYDLDLLFDTFSKKAEKFAPPSADKAMVLLLRSFQPSLKVLFSEHAIKEWRIEFPESTGKCAYAVKGEEKIAIFPARQVAAKERIELLGFFGEEEISDGKPIFETACELRAKGFDPVIAWGKGKWLFKRAAIIKSLIKAEAKKEPRPFIGDSALRPLFWIEPLYKMARRYGLSFTYGSDPLPGAGNETKAGNYGMLIDAAMTGDYKEMLCLLRHAPSRSCGKRPVY